MGTCFARLLPALAMAAMAATHPASAEPLGRLFFTPEQRATLESLRLAPAAATTAATTDRITVNGLVQRSGGPTTVWINGVPQTVPPQSIVPAGKTRTPAVQVPVPGEPGRIRLKVGQSIEVNEPAPDESGPGNDSGTRPRSPGPPGEPPAPTRPRSWRD